MIVTAERPRELIRRASAKLRSAGSDQAKQEAEWLLACLAGTGRLELYAEDTFLSPRVVRRFEAGITRRCRGVPIQHLIGHTDFYGANFQVAPGVFIPRPETEQVVEALAAALNSRRTPPEGWKILELGVGSGCICCTLARLLKTCEIVGIDVSYEALRLARRNAQRLGVASKIRWVQSDWDSALDGEFDCIVSNPPYIPSADIDNLPLEVRCEPRRSLDGGADGMSDLLKLMTNLPSRLKPEGFLVFECGELQVEPLLRKAALEAWVREAKPIRDLAGFPRGVLLQKAAR